MEFGGAVAEGGDVIQSAEVAYDNIEDYFSNSDDIIQGEIAEVKNTAGGMAKEWAVSQVCRGSLKKQLRYLTSQDPDTYLKNLGIQGGVDGITFEGTTWFDTSRELDIVMTYRIEYDFGVLGRQEKEFKVRAKTAIW